MKKIFIVVFAFVAFVSYSQDSNVKYEQKGDLTLATYMYEDGSVRQQGTFDSDGKLHGTWVSYDVNGNKVTIGNYERGLKTGKWLFYTEDSVREVNYVDSKIASVSLSPLNPDM